MFYINAVMYIIFNWLSTKHLIITKGGEVVKPQSCLKIAKNVTVLQIVSSGPPKQSIIYQKYCQDSYALHLSLL